MARPRIKDVARRAGVSEKTVSNVINDYAHVSEKTRSAVREAIAELGYRVNLAGRHLRRGRTGIIALVVPELTIPYFAELATQVIRDAERRSLTVLVHQSKGSHEHELAALDGFGFDFTDGLILSPLALTTQDIAERTGTLPTVLLGEYLEEGADHVAIDNELAAREATEHLLALGRRSILALGGRDAPGTGTAEARTRGFRAALEAADIRYDPADVLPVPEYRIGDGVAALRAVLAAGRRPDAVLCYNDLLALGALRALHEAGLRVPADVAAIGFDDVEAGRFSVPSLTTVAPDKAAVARTAVELLVRRIEGGSRDDGPRNVVVPHRLLVRESAGPAPGR
ncbi:LacI family DNA-binding transcriptional regulator [Streptomyces sp. NPDC049881]|uniref:LacI family DNA-binding transcriptional regulator n=1 Tax=Streptomyces sp. NPDC049881 TaxID=3155778 RepID=UPI003417648A